MTACLSGKMLVNMNEMINRFQSNTERGGNMQIGQLLNRRKFMSRMPLLTAVLGLAGHKPLNAGKYEGNRFQERMADRFPAFNDKRGKKVIFVAHCLINQNARCPVITVASIPAP